MSQYTGHLICLTWCLNPVECHTVLYSERTGVWRAVSPLPSWDLRLDRGPTGTYTTHRVSNHAPVTDLHQSG